MPPLKLADLRALSAEGKAQLSTVIEDEIEIIEAMKTEPHEYKAYLDTRARLLELKQAVAGDIL